MHTYHTGFTNDIDDDDDDEALLMAVKVLVPVLLVLVLSRWVVQKEEAPKSATDIQLDIDSQLPLLLFGIAVISSCRNTRSSLKLNFISSCGFCFCCWCCCSAIKTLKLLFVIICGTSLKLQTITTTPTNKPSRNH